MKIRNGFVSNSSSTSYVILVPNDFDVDACVFANLDKLREAYREEHWQEFPAVRYRGKKGEPDPPQPRVIIPFEYINEFIQRFKGYLKKGAIHEGNIPRGKYMDMETVRSIMNDLVMSRIEGGPDEGTITFVKEDFLRNKLNNFKNGGIPENEREEIIKKIKEERADWERIKAEAKTKMKHIDPYGEEQWEN